MLNWRPLLHVISLHDGKAFIDLLQLAGENGLTSLDSVEELQNMPVVGQQRCLVPGGLFEIERFYTGNKGPNQPIEHRAVDRPPNINERLTVDNHREKKSNRQHRRRRLDALPRYHLHCG